MKKILIIITALLFANSSFAQITDEIRNYFRDSLLQLDPIEGIWDMTAYVQEYVEDYQWPARERNNEIAIVRISQNEFRICGNENTTFKRIGDTNIYNVYIRFKVKPATCRAYLSQGTLKYEYNIPIENNKNGDDHYYRAGFNCIKIYPTTSMYVDAIREAQEQAKPTEWTGTGFALKDNYIVTNFHVVDGAKSISVLGINGSFIKGYSADVIATDKINDLAIIKVNGVTISSANIPYSIKNTTSDVGEEVFVLGYPLTSTMGEEIKLTTGVISSKTGFQGDVSIYQISAPIQPGNSGGPLFDSKGNVIGIVSAKHSGAENVGYAIKASYLKNLMESALPANILPQNNRIAGQNLSGKVKSVQKYVYYITCSSK